jgi:MoaA/NifB/PqqE/SkfB family radical SAM enzyme
MAAMDTLRKIYVEPTNVCNLDCRTCVRQVWDESLGEMSDNVFAALVDGLRAFPAVETVAFMGCGEPLLHPRLPEMVASAHAQGWRTELTTNGMLLKDTVAEQLAGAGLDQLVVSIDGVKAETFAEVRRGASPLGEVVANVEAFHDLVEARRREPLTVGIEFVAMRRNVAELPALRHVAAAVRAAFVLVSNVIPYTPALAAETLYDRGVTAMEHGPLPGSPVWRLPYLDIDEQTAPPLFGVLASAASVNYLGTDLTVGRPVCPFAEAGAAAIGWQGGVSPCPPLLHSYPLFVLGRAKQVRRCEFGRLPGSSLREVWQAPAYAAFRQRLAAFDFSPCVDCACELAEENEEDCLGNVFPVCGDCLWAHGVARCP